VEDSRAYRGVADRDGLGQAGRRRGGHRETFRNERSPASIQARRDRRGVGVWGYHRDSASRATAGEYTAEDGRSNAGSGRREGQANVSHIIDLRISIVIDASWIRQQCCSKSPSTGPDCVRVEHGPSGTLRASCSTGPADTRRCSSVVSESRKCMPRGVRQGTGTCGLVISEPSQVRWAHTAIHLRASMRSEEREAEQGLAENADPGLLSRCWSLRRAGSIVGAKDLVDAERLAKSKGGCTWTRPGQWGRC
jgi:hypothetical protein